MFERCDWKDLFSCYIWFWQVVLSSGKAVADIEPNFHEIKKCPGLGIIVTGLAPAGSGFDFISRYFSPKLEIDEVICLTHCRHPHLNPPKFIFPKHEDPQLSSLKKLFIPLHLSLSTLFPPWYGINLSMKMWIYNLLLHLFSCFSLACCY